jgi:ATP-dependent DNA helicase 2 subunit 2
MIIEETFNPYIHRVTDAICQRAMYPDEEIAPPAEILTKWSNPPSKLVSKAMPELQRLVNVMNVKPGM